MTIQIENPLQIYYLNSNSETEFKMHSQFSCKLCPGAWNTQDLQMHVCLQYIITTSVIMTLETYFSLRYQTVVWTYGSRICHSAFRTVGAKYACLDLNTFLWSFITLIKEDDPQVGCMKYDQSRTTSAITLTYIGHIGSGLLIQREIIFTKMRHLVEHLSIAVLSSTLLTFLFISLHSIDILAKQTLQWVQRGADLC